MSNTKKCCLTAAHESRQVLLSSTSAEAQISLGIKEGEKKRGGYACTCEKLSHKNPSELPFVCFPILPVLGLSALCFTLPIALAQHCCWKHGGAKWNLASQVCRCFSFARGINQKEKKCLLAQSSGLFIFLPAATCYPLRGSRKTSHGLGWSDMSNPNCRPGPSQWITTLSGTYYIYTYIHTYMYFFSIKV